MRPRERGGVGGSCPTILSEATRTVSRVNRASPFLVRLPSTRRPMPLRRLFLGLPFALAACAQAVTPGTPATPEPAPPAQMPVAVSPTPPPARADTFARAPRRGYVPKSSRADTLR